MSLWADYAKERLGHQTIEWENAFISFSIENKVCVLQEVYVRPLARKLGVASKLARIVEDEAKRQGCTHIWAQVEVLSNGATDSLKACLAYGFKLLTLEGSRIILMKEL